MRQVTQPPASIRRSIRWVIVTGLQFMLAVSFLSSQATGGDAWRWLRKDPKVPHQAPCPANMITLAKEVTKLEDQVRRNGSITIKQPDVWGESNLMSYIQEYETQMQQSVAYFRETIQGVTLKTDTAQFASSTALGVGADATAFGNAQTAAANAANQQNPPAAPTPLANLGSVLSTLKPTTVLSNGTSVSTPFGLEPNELERQHSVYVQMNQALRRTNMGDDNSRAAGNSLYLLRFPVSVLPGRETFQGYSAVITLRAHLAIDANHLRYTFPKMVVADAINGVLPILKAFWNKETVTSKAEHSASSSTPFIPPLGLMPSSPSLPQGPVVNSITLGSVEQVINQYGTEPLTELLKFVKLQFPQGQPKDEEMKAFLFAQFVNLYEQLIAREVFSSSGQQSDVVGILASTGAAVAKGDCTVLDAQRLCWANSLPLSAMQVSCTTEPKAFSWILGFHAAILDANINRLIHARKQASGTGVFEDDLDTMFHFYIVNGPRQPELNSAWAKLIEAEFPIHVFALNPVIEEQNVYDAFSRSRDLQLAFAMAVANGNMRASQAMRFSRKVTLDMAAIGLNRTAVAFAHENDTFGWYFHPRVQSPPPERSNIAALGRLIWSSGPTNCYDEKHQKLDPGIRECEAVIVMPGFVPGLRFDVITNWEKRNKPGAVKRDYAEMLVQGAQIQRALSYASQVGDQQCFRPDDHSILVSRVEQIEKMLPLQSVNVRLPFEHELSGSQLFDGGKSHLKPALDGFYGLTYVAGTDMAEVFLTGANFHPILSRVILGGREADEVKVISRTLLKVRFKQVTKSLSADPVETRVATPAGISPPLLIPMAPSAPAKTGFTWNPDSLAATFRYVGITAQHFTLQPVPIEIKYQGIPQVGFPKTAQAWVIPKYLKPDGSELKPAADKKPIQVKNSARTDGQYIFDKGAIKVTGDDLASAIGNDLQSGDPINFTAGLQSFTISAETYLVLDGAGTPIKVDAPLAIKLAAQSTDSPHALSAPSDSYPIPAEAIEQPKTPPPPQPEGNDGANSMRFGRPAAMRSIVRLPGTVVRMVR